MAFSECMQVNSEEIVEIYASMAWARASTADWMIRVSLLVSRISGSTMEILGTRVRVMIDIFTARSTSVMMQNWEISEPLPAVVVIRTIGGSGRLTRFALAMIATPLAVSIELPPPMAMITSAPFSR